MSSSRKGKEGAEEGEQKHGQISNKKRKEIFPYGNYKSYYGYRIGQEMEEDARLKVFKKEWFEGKDCLDIGCNSGIMTIQIAKKFCCQSILGVDIDANRIQDAYWHARKILRTDNARKTLGKASKLEGASGSSEEKDLLDTVSFRKEDFVNSRDPHKNNYDTIICLSVSKWIHLNWGDDGLITLFTRVWSLLRSGGIFVLEPQPWKSYEKNYRVSETTRENYRNLMFYPKDFQDLLLDKVGFRKVEDISSSVSGSKAGFNRPILVFHK